MGTTQKSALGILVLLPLALYAQTPAAPASAPAAQPASPSATPPSVPAHPRVQNGIALWHLPTPRLTAMLNGIPRSDDARYDRLRQYFIEFGCTGNSLQEPPLDKNGHRHNLLCTLPGEDPRPILVAAWYPDRRLYGDASRGWPDAIMVPVLYNALSAQPRHFTFVFAAFDGPDGEYAYFHRRHASGSAAPLALVFVSALGLSPPHFYTEPPDSMPAKSRSASRTVLDTAAQVAQLQGIDIGQSYLPIDLVSNSSFSLGPAPADPKEVPRIVFFSTYSDTVTLDAFEQDWNLLGFFLGSLDHNFANPSREATAH